MTEVAFHFNAPARQAYACRLLRKAYLRQARLLVRTEAQALHALDAALWTFSGGDFIPHASTQDLPQVQRHSPILLYAEDSPMPTAWADPAATVLVNLCASMPTGFERFARVIEVVTQDEADRQHARQRWRSYRQMGIEPIRHDLKLEPQG